MSEERTLIIQMVADGKITAEEADMLLQAIEESERAAQEAAAESVRRQEQARQESAAPRRTLFDDLGETIEMAVKEGLRAADAALRSLEVQLDGRWMDDRLRHRLEEKIRRSTEKAVEKARAAQQRASERAREVQERAQRHAERAARRAAEHAQRLSERLERKAWHHGWDAPPRPPVPPAPPASATPPVTIFKTGIQIDKVSVERVETATTPAQPGDLLKLQNRVGDITVEFTTGQQIELEAKKTVWGSDQSDAETRAAATSVTLVRNGADVEVSVTHPAINAVGVTHIKDTRIDYVIKVPYGTHLELRTKVGDIRVTAGNGVSLWTLETQVGDVDLTVGAGAGFQWTAQTKIGTVEVDLPGVAGGASGTAGDGSGRIIATVKTGDIRIHQE